MVDKKPLVVRHLEMTDTFGGEANYSWVKKEKIEISEGFNNRELFKKIREAFEIPASTKFRVSHDSGDLLRLDVVGACICIFVSWGD